jgi:leucyl-tRNA synthetase
MESVDNASLCGDRHRASKPEAVEMTTGEPRAGRYNPRDLERHWQERWEADRLYETAEAGNRPKWYQLTMLPYPSGDLHIGHWYAMVPSDARARFRRMQGHDVLFPMGFDSFGLPAENAAIQRNIHPKTWTYANIDRMRGQLRSMGAMFDWSREAVSSDAAYYRWTQWFFLKLYERGLAYRAKGPANFCPKCNTVLANEQVVGDERRCDRCDTPVEIRDLTQWFFKITAYAEELLKYDGLEWPERVIAMQKNWIGKSVGVEFEWKVKGGGKFSVFTTRPDTLFGATFAVLAPEHPLVCEVTAAERRAEVDAVLAATRRVSEIERLSTKRERTGVFTGAYAVHPFTGADVPIYIADYVLPSYGTGAIMAVPAHDSRDFDFAKRYGIPIRVVIMPDGGFGDRLTEAYPGDGAMVESGEFTGLPSAEGWTRVAEAIERKGIGARKVNYRLRDWLVSRQRYWGSPIPVVYCDRCGTVPVPEKALPVQLPDDVEFRPTGDSPLGRHAAFLNTKCPACAGPATRETDTLDTFVCSCWYFMRYLSPANDAAPFDAAEAKRWLPVDEYTGGIEHACMHLLYARFFWKAVRDMGLVAGDEPFKRLFNQGMILGEDGEKMSKSRGNVIDPDKLVAELGADTVRVFLMFIGPWELGGPWNSRGIEGCVRFLQRAFVVGTESPKGSEREASPRELERLVHKTTKTVTRDVTAFQFNTAIAALMEYVNDLMKLRETVVARNPLWTRAREVLALLLAPLAPHLADEIWASTGKASSVHAASWPAFDEALTKDDTVTLVVQVNGKVRDRIEVSAAIAEDDAKKLALASERVVAFVGDKAPRKVIVVPGKLVNIVV